MWVKIQDIKTGDSVRIDAGFDCMSDGFHEVFRNVKGLYLKCNDMDDEGGHHYLDGQVDDRDTGEMVGVVDLIRRSPSSIM